MDSPVLSKMNSTDTSPGETTLDQTIDKTLLAVYYFLRFGICDLSVLFGIPGNTMSFLVTTKKSNRRISTCVYMTALSVTDNIVCWMALVDSVTSYWEYSRYWPRKDLIVL